MTVQMKALEAGSIGRTRDPRHLVLDAVALRWAVGRVHLEILGHCVDRIAQLPQERRIAKRRRHDNPRQEDDRNAFPLVHCRFLSHHRLASPSSRSATAPFVDLWSVCWRPSDRTLRPTILSM